MATIISVMDLHASCKLMKGRLYLKQGNLYANHKHCCNLSTTRPPSSHPDGRCHKDNKQNTHLPH